MHPKGCAHHNPHSAQPATYTSCRLHWHTLSMVPGGGPATQTLPQDLLLPGGGTGFCITTVRARPCTTPRQGHRRRTANLKTTSALFWPSSSSSGARPPSDTVETMAFFYPTGALFLLPFCVGSQHPSDISAVTCPNDISKWHPSKTWPFLWSNGERALGS